MKLLSWLKRLFHRKKKAAPSRDADVVQKPQGLSRSEIRWRLQQAREKRKQGHDIGKFMKSGRQAPWYRKSIKEKKQPEED